MVSSQRQSAIALVIVLAMLVLLSGLLVAFMSTVTAERNSTSAAAAGSTARQIADNTVNLVIAQIREATTRYTDTAAWASQPGAIRVFSGRAGSRITTDKGGYQLGYDPGTNDWVYKLYSSENMKVKSQEYSPSGDGMKLELDAIENWTTNPDERFVDMNEPVLVPRPDLSSAGTAVVEPRYPIIDPRAAFDKNGSRGNANDYGIVKGFAASISDLPGSTRMAGNENVPILPMPVQWMYVLQDGSIFGPDAIDNMDKELEHNPIIGRTAFWADDESSKVNINTASEGTFWDTPTGSSDQESGNVSPSGALISSATSFSLGASQPARGEVQRYGGHPATTCLSPILGDFWDLADGYTSWRDPKLLTFKEDIYQMAPYLPYGAGTSLGGTDNPDPERPDRRGMRIDPKTTEPLLKLATKHLYANPDEYLFQSERNNGGGASPAILNGDGHLNPDDMEKVRFFLTANSRAPEVNLFNRPRITFWPVSDIAQSNASASLRQRTNFDNLFAFASTIGGERFYMSRDEAKSSTRDISLDQNVKILRYLQWLTGNGPSQIPGFGGNFKEKLGGVGERDELLALMFDYVRCVNLVDTGTTRLAQQGQRYIPYTPFYGEGQAGYGGFSERSFDWSGQVTPSVANGFPLKKDSKGLGRFIEISEAALIFTRAGAVAGGSQKQIQAVLALEMASTMPGLPVIRETYWTLLRSVQGGPQLILGTQQSPIIPPPDAGDGWVNIVNVSSHEVGFGRGYMPTLGFHNSMHFFPEHKGTTDPTPVSQRSEPRIKLPVCRPKTSAGMRLTWADRPTPEIAPLLFIPM